MPTIYKIIVEEKKISDGKNSKLHFVIWQKTAPVKFRQLTEIWQKSSNKSASQIHGWMFLKEKFIISVFTLLFAN